MKGDDDEEEDSGAINVGRYPCLPSLVALQQMRNRLHLAHTGRKLMKWTALATGREQRRIAGELIEAYKSYEMDIRNAYIQLARCRYFYPNLNLIVTGNAPNHPKTAQVTVATTMKSVTGCRMINFEVLNTKQDSYAHLAMDKGGQCVAEAKRLWFELLKKMLLILQLRTSYMLAEMAHKNANKKWNVLSKIVIPRTEKSIKYILDELEERDREEFFRMKKILAVKARKKKANEPAEVKVEVCPVCEEIKQQVALVAENRCYVCGKLKSGEEDKKDEKDVEDMKKLKELASQIDQLVGMTKEINEQGIVKENFNDFIQTAELLKDKLVVKEEEVKPSKPIPIDAPLDKLCPSCVKKLKQQIEDAKRVQEAIEIRTKLESTSIQILKGKVDEEIKQSFAPNLFKLPPQIPVPERKMSLVPPILPHTHDVAPPQKEECEMCAAEKSKAKEDDELKSEQQKELSPMKTPCPHMQQASETSSTDETEYGIFETQYKEVTKIIRTRNEDGTISEERKVIRVKKETKTPEVDQKIQQKILRSIKDGKALGSNAIDRQESDTSGTPNQSRRTIGLALVDPHVRNAHSVIAVPTFQVDVESRFCVSDSSELSLIDCERCCMLENSNLESLTNSEKICSKCCQEDSDSSTTSISDVLSYF